MKKNKVGLVLEGGGLRGIFTAGALDYLMERGVKFDYVIGVSAGSCNTFQYLGNKKGFLKTCMLESEGKDSFFGVQQMVESHKIVDLDKVFDEYAEMYGFDYKKFMKNKTEWEMVVTNVKTGKAEYLSDRKDLERAKTISKASCSLPIITSPKELDGKLYLDGGIADSIPVKRAQEMGCDKVVVICTRRKDKYPHMSDPEKAVVEQLYKKYPKLISTMYRRENVYKKTKKYIDEQDKKGKVIQITPTLPEIGRLETDEEKLKLYYYHGYAKAEDNYKDIMKFFK